MLRKQIANTRKSGKTQWGSTSIVWNKVRIEILSVICLVFVAYKEGLTSGVNMFVVVPQAIGISLHNRIGDSVGGSLAIDSFLGIHQCPLIDGFSKVFDLNTSIHTC